MPTAIARIGAQAHRQYEIDNPDDKREAVGTAVVSTLDGPLDEICAVGPDQRGEFAHDGAAGRSLTEGQPSDRNDDHQNGDERRDAVKGYRCAARERIAGDVDLDRAFENFACAGEDAAGERPHML